MTKLWLLSVNETAKARFSTLSFGGQVVPPLAAAVASALYLIWVLFSWPGPAEFTEMPAEELPPAPAAEPVADYLDIADWHLLGREETGVEEEAAEVAATTLRLKLLGTFLLSGPSANRYAIIQNADGMQQKYREGDTLPEEAVLRRIEKTRVLLERRQRNESLQFDPNPLSLSAPNP
ncbi:hypothetical protein NP590_06965 [Methylomonas sp. SURF-2]|uniref:Type II secretion system protein GspC N-terminal domain-containing protein n=1 Tax=Methylomonas subterranea TaxID=2952225 RepID=A0ABT1TEX2_9GAMM|nr:type II secretion system protein N [Methylomonas sp. SURF-2]MCQ8103839.1 hypothetical protein [Methylomonas sp. SURF-2]